MARIQLQRTKVMLGDLDLSPVTMSATLDRGVDTINAATVTIYVRRLEVVDDVLIIHLEHPEDKP